MHEFIEVRLQRAGKRLEVARELSDGIEFNEPDPIRRTIAIGFDAATDATRERMNSIRRVHGWEPGQFKLHPSVERGSIILRGVNAHALPEGLYRVQLEIEEAKTISGFRRADVKHNRGAVVTVDIETDNRDVEVDLTGAAPEIRRVLDRSVVDGTPCMKWLEDETRRPTRQACLLNLLASLRTRPTVSSPLLTAVSNVFFVGSDRVYATVERAMLQRLTKLADDDAKPFYAEGPPHAAVHGKLLEAIPDAERGRFKDLLSFRSEGAKGAPSMQIVIAVPPSDLPHTYVDLDLDLGNPLQDVLGFLVHMGELLDGKPTNHLDLRKKLAKTRARDFLYYSVVAS